jgi:hypothetical protein
MPLDENEIEGQSSSADLAQDGAAAAAADAASSAATGETDDSLLSVVRDAVAESRKEGAEQAASPAEGAEEEGSDPPEGQSADEDDYSNVPFNQHPRFKALVTEKNRYKAELATVRDDAERFQRVQSFISDQGLEPDEVAEGLVIMGLMKTNPAEAYRRLEPTLQKLLVASGRVLPDDLRQRVAAGELSQAAAQEISVARAQVASQQAHQQFVQQRGQQTAEQTARQAAQQAANDWEAKRRRNDPNFSAKLEPLKREIAFLQRTEGVPNTPDGVRDQLDRAYKSLVPPAAAVAPQKRPITPVRGGQVAGKTAPQAETMLDIVRQNRRSA